MAPDKAPQNILEIKYANPDAPTDPDWAKRIAGGKFPKDSAREWTQVLAPQEDYDQFTLVGATGWVRNPHFVTRDFPFCHPFGFDWEFELEPDQPYGFLLAPGNADTGLLGVEIDGGLVPQGFSVSGSVQEGDRMAVFGRWIVDCGHDDPFRSEIHPPLLMVRARASTDSDGSQTTQVLFTSRPYLVGQTYTVDTDKIYDDTAADDGTFRSHMENEVAKVNSTIFGIPTESVQVEAHPKIKSHPFLGAHLLHLVIRAPSPSPSHTGVLPVLDVGHLETVQPTSVVSPPPGPVAASPVGVLQPETEVFLRPRAGAVVVSFQFTVRSGCAVRVISSASDTIDVFISLSHAGYTPPPLPKRNEQTWSRKELDDLQPGVGDDYLKIEALSAALQAISPESGSIIGSGVVTAIFERGIKTDVYVSDVRNPRPPQDVDILNADHAVTNAPVNNIPSDSGVTQDDSQPYPVYGWLTVKSMPAAPPVDHP